MTSHRGKEHSMKRTAVILGVAAAMGVFASAAVGSPGQSEGLPVVKPAFDRPLPVLHTTYNGRIMYRLGNKGVWME
jgi:hypothetical protein